MKSSLSDRTTCARWRNPSIHGLGPCLIVIILSTIRVRAFHTTVFFGIAKQNPVLTATINSEAPTIQTGLSIMFP